MSTTVVGNPIESTWPHYVVTNSDGPGLEALGRVLGLCWSGVTWEVCKTDAGNLMSTSWTNQGTIQCSLNHPQVAATGSSWMMRR